MNSNKHLDSSASMINPSHTRISQSTTPEKERKKYNDLHSTGRVKDLLKQNKISMEKLFTKFDFTHHEEVSPYKKRQQESNIMESTISIMQNTAGNANKNQSKILDETTISKTVRHLAGFEIPPDSCVDEIIQEESVIKTFGQESSRAK